MRSEPMTCKQMAQAVGSWFAAVWDYCFVAGSATQATTASAMESARMHKKGTI